MITQFLRQTFSGFLHLEWGNLFSGCSVWMQSKWSNCGLVSCCNLHGKQTERIFTRRERAGDENRLVRGRWVDLWRWCQKNLPACLCVFSDESYHCPHANCAVLCEKHVNYSSWYKLWTKSLLSTETLSRTFCEFS